jgi:hypothetical protein
MSVKLEYLINQHIQEKISCYSIPQGCRTQTKSTWKRFYYVHKKPVFFSWYIKVLLYYVRLKNITYLFDSILFSIAIVTKTYYKCMVIWKVGKRNNAPKTQWEMYFWYPICYVLVYEWMGKTHTAIIYSF